MSRNDGVLGISASWGYSVNTHWSFGGNTFMLGFSTAARRDRRREELP